MECNNHQKKLIKYLVSRCVNVFDISTDAIETGDHYIKITIYNRPHRQITVESTFYSNAEDGLSLDICFYDNIDSQYIKMFSLLHFVYNKIDINSAIKACEYLIVTTPCPYKGD